MFANTTAARNCFHSLVIFARRNCTDQNWGSLFSTVRRRAAKSSLVETATAPLYLCPANAIASSNRTSSVSVEAKQRASRFFDAGRPFSRSGRNLCQRHGWVICGRATLYRSLFAAQTKTAAKRKTQVQTSSNSCGGDRGFRSSGFEFACLDLPAKPQSQVRRNTSFKFPIGKLPAFPSATRSVAGHSIKAGKELQSIWFPVPTRLRSTTAINPQGAIHSTQERNRLLGHTCWVSFVTFSPDGEIIATASSDRTVKLWKRDGTLIRTVAGHGGAVNCVSFSPDGQTIVTASSDKTIKLWSRDGLLLRTLTGHSQGVNGALFSPDGQTLLSASDDCTIKLWSKQGQLLRTFFAPRTKGVSSVSFSPNGQAIASAADGGTIQLWRQNGKLLTTLQAEGEQVTSVSFSPDAKTLASGTS